MIAFFLGAAVVGLTAAFFLPVLALAGMIVVATIAGAVVAFFLGDPLSMILVECLLCLVGVQVGYASGLVVRTFLVRRRSAPASSTEQEQPVGSLGSRLFKAMGQK